MKSLARRRLGLMAVALIMVVLIIAAWWLARAALLADAYATGWTLLGICLVLAAYNLRKKLTFLPLLASAAWLQVHLYLGLVSVAVFLVHTGFRVPTGTLEWLLAGLYVAVAATGVAGLVLSRTLPPRLNTRGENIIFERLPVIRRQLHAQAEALVLESIESGDATIVPDLYRKRLLAFFSGPRHFWSHLLGSEGPRHELLGELDSARRYMANTDQRGLDRLADLVCAKDDVDYRHAAYLVLKGWLFVHIPLTYALLMVAMVHLVLVHAFTGGVR